MALPQDGQDANGLTKVTQIPAGKELMFIDPTTNEGGIITLEDLTKQILNGLASQAFALDAGQMTLLAALNKLNSKRLCMQQVYENGVWNDCNNIPIGETAMVFNSAKNKPLGNSTWFIFCMGSVKDNIKYQLAISYMTPFSVKARTYDSTTGNWLDWK